MGESSNNDGGLPFKEPVDSAELNLAADPIEGDATQSAALVESSSGMPDAQKSGKSDQPVDELPAKRLLEQLSVGFDSDTGTGTGGCRETSGATAPNRIKKIG